MPTPSRSSFRQWFFLALALLAGSTIIANAQFGGQGGPEKPRPRPMEFLNQEVQAAAVVETLNEISKQGWEVFDIIPVWKFHNAGGEDNGLVPQSYQVFGRRPVEAGK